MKIFRNSEEKKKIDGIMKSIFNILQDSVKSIPNLIKNQKKKTPEERSKNLKALILTFIIITILIFIFLKVPFLKKLIFP